MRLSSPFRRERQFQAQPHSSAVLKTCLIDRWYRNHEVDGITRQGVRVIGSFGNADWADGHLQYLTITDKDGLAVGAGPTRRALSNKALVI
jgi:hypothetical protein